MEVVACTCPVCGRSVPQLAVSTEVLDVVVGVLAAGSPTLAGLELKERVSCPEEAAHAWVSHLLSCAAAWPTYAADEDVLRSVDAAFADVARPEHFTNFTHCDECREHDDTLRSRTRATLQRQDLGTAGWDPISFCSAEGIGYFFPALARFALLPAVWRDRDWYADQLLSHLAWEGAENRFLLWCSPVQRQAVATLLAHLHETRAAAITQHGCEAELSDAIRIWGEAGALPG